MNRRSFLAALGVAPIAATGCAAPAAATERPFVFRDGTAELSNAAIGELYPVDIERLAAETEEHLEWIGEDAQAIITAIRTLSTEIPRASNSVIGGLSARIA